MSARIPLAWLQLTREKRRFVAALAGISFAVVLMLMQLGFQDALLSSVTLFHDHLIGDLVLINPQYQNIISPKTFTERRIVQVLGVDGVESVEAVYVAQLPFKNPFDGTERNIFLIGFDPRTAVLTAPGVAEGLGKIRIQGQMLFDSIRRPEFGPIAELFTEKGPVIVEVSGRRVDVVGLLQLGTSFGADGNLVMSDETFLRVSGNRQRGSINIGVISLAPGADAERVKSDIAGLLPPDVTVLTRREFAVRERTYWVENTPIGFVFQLGVMMGVFVGCIIVYQILYTDVTDHLPEYATLKAMGYSNLFLFKVVIQEALILSVLGFLPGVVISHFVYGFSRDATMLPMQLTAPRVGMVYLLTLFMCALSATLATRRLKAADPAEIF